MNKHEIACFKARISTELRDADEAALHNKHQCALKHVASAAIMIRELRDAEELAAQESKHDLAILECGQ